MVIRETGDIEDKVLKDHLDSINQEMLQNAIELDDAPSAGTPLLEDNTIGINGTSLYVRKGLTIYVFASDSTITIT